MSLLKRKSEAPAGDVTMEVDGEGDIEGETKEQKKARKEAKKQVSLSRSVKIMLLILKSHLMIL